MDNNLINSMVEEMRKQLSAALPKIRQAEQNGMGFDIKLGFKTDMDPTDGLILVTSLSFTVEKFKTTSRKALNQLELFH